MRLRVPAWTSPGRRRDALLPAAPPGTEPSHGAADLLFRSAAGRLFLVSSAVKLLVALLRRTPVPAVLTDVLSAAATVGLVLSLGYFLWRLFALMKRRLLWRVRRKLILSYIFIGAVPALLIVGFFLLMANLVSMNISAYLFKDAYDSIVEDLKLTADAVAAQIAERPEAAGEILVRTHATLSRRHPGLAMALVPRRGGTPIVPRAWLHQQAPVVLPSWLPAEGFEGTVVVAGDEQDELQLVIRAVRPARGPGGAVGSVVVDLPIDDHLMDRLRDATGVEAETPEFSASLSETRDALIDATVRDDSTNQFELFRNTLVFLDAQLWDTGARRGATVSMTYDVRDLWDRISGVQSQRAQVRGFPLAQLFLLALAFVAVLFLIIQGVALLMGLALARSITSSIHELFMGTERVRQGDFTHRIRVETRDQLGDLAQSFNQMTGSIEGLLLTAAEKKRLDEELRIARQIQMSLLPRGPLDFQGLGVTALCIPAREVGGDYYDFFHLAGDRLGVLIADVAGKGTSAALYMAELKGLMLALSQTYESPRELLIEVNRIISENLDARTFITMTYAVVDPRRGTMTYCRAGHTPLIYLPGSSSPGARGAQTLTPDGMVVGLRIPGAPEKFTELLEEWRIDLRAGDIVVLYTDGITEAMNGESDLFGDGRLSRIVEEHGHLDSGELRERILREIESFVGGADQHDDMTMILIKVEESFQMATV